MIEKNIADDASYVADLLLKPLAQYYQHDWVEEIEVNRPGEVWIKRRGYGWYPRHAPELTYEWLTQRVMRTLANISGGRFNEFSAPMVGCELPGLPFRFQGIAGGNVSYEMGDRKGVALAIRSLMSDKALTLESFGLVKGDHAPRRTASMPGLHECEADFFDKIAKAVRDHLSIVVSGATGTGKTTFLKNVIRLIDLRQRVITLEDLRELHIPHPNRVHLTLSKNKTNSTLTYQDMVDLLMRMTPDYIPCGEVYVRNAFPVFSLIGKGHPVFTTIHASSPDLACEAFANNMTQAGVEVDRDSVIGTLKKELGCIIQLERDSITSVRRVVAVEFPAEDFRRAAAIAEARGRAPFSPAEA